VAGIGARPLGCRNVPNTSGNLTSPSARCITTFLQPKGRAPMRGSTVTPLVPLKGFVFQIKKIGVSFNFKA